MGESPVCWFLFGRETKVERGKQFAVLFQGLDQFFEFIPGCILAMTATEGVDGFGLILNSSAQFIKTLQLSRGNGGGQHGRSGNVRAYGPSGY